MAWVYVVAADQWGSFNAIVTNDNGGFDRGFGIASGNKWDVRIGNTRDISQSVSEGWQHGCVIYTSSNVYFYANGSLVYTKGSAAGASTGSNLKIAAPSYFDGQISNVMVFKQELSASQISTYFDDQKGQFGIT